MDNYSYIIYDFLDAIHKFDSKQLDTLFEQSVTELSFDEFSTNILAPVMDELGNNWSNKPGIAYEHFFSSWVKAKLYGALLKQTSSPKKTLVCACCPESQHEIGLLLFSLKLIHAGFKIIYLGPNLPIQQAQLAAEKVDADGIILSSFLTPSIEVQKSLIELTIKYKKGVFLGGRGFKSPSNNLKNSTAILLEENLSRATNTIRLMI